MNFIKNTYFSANYPNLYKIMKKQLLLVFLFVVSLTTKGQNNGYWSEVTTNKNSIVTHKSVARQSFPSEYKLFQLNADALKNQMYAICDATEGSKKQSSTTITLPNAKGGLEEFEIYEASNFDTELQARFPEIRAFSGVSKIDGSILKIAISPINISSTIFRNDAPTEIIEQYSNDASIYSVYDRSKNSRGKLGWTCSTIDEPNVDYLNHAVENTQKASNGQLKVMRLAQSCNAEYSNYFGATSAAQVANVLTAFNNTLTRCNGVYEKDLGLHLNLVNQTTNVIYYAAASDPYTTLGSWNTQLQQALNTTLTGTGTTLAANNAAYDIGHMFGSTGGGGNAGCIGCPCVPGVTAGTGSTKGRGITSPADGIPSGDNFDIDYVVHEIGHQLGGNHTFSNSNEGTGVQMEVGSGITIMGYAGITTEDFTNHSIDKYHAVTINQILNDADFIGCGVNTNISARNATPTVTITGTALTIPISTPFALDCAGTDADAGDVLTYSWEQMNEPATRSAATSNATATKTSGPNFASWQATTSTTRYFPKMSTCIANLLLTTQVNGDTGMNSEALVSVARSAANAFSFRVTVRDNAPYVSTPGSEKVGQTNVANMTVTTSTTGGAFSVSSQGTAGLVYTGGSVQTVTWTSAHTVAPYNVATVDILISYDNGVTWTTILAGTPNDGTEAVTMPNPATNQTNCRLMVRSAVTATQKSYFFDLNNNAFTLNRNLSTEVFEITNLELYPNPNRGNFNIKFDATSNNVKVLVHDIRGRQIFDKNYNNNGVFNQEINLENTQSGVYLVSVFDGNKKTTKRVVIE